MQTCDFLVIGAGIAGASAAYELAAHGRTVVLERETVAGHHSTGRSAAVLTENYGNPTVRRLTLATRPFLERPPDGFAEQSLTAPRRMLWIAREDQRTALAASLAEARRLVPGIHAVTTAEAATLCPVLRDDYVAAGVLEPDALDLDVHAIHQGFLCGLRARGGRLVTDAEVTGLTRSDAGWEVRTPAARYAAGVVVNAAGAWCDVIGKLAGARPVGLVPKRRTAFTFAAPRDTESAAWPVVADVGEEFYFKPESGAILASPADETPMSPCDVFPDDYDVAVAIERIQRATTLDIRTISRKWAGLRSFVAHRTPVAGMDAERPGFFWLAGQGGYGIQTSAALARCTAGLIVDRRLPAEIAALGVAEEELAPRRARESGGIVDC